MSLTLETLWRMLPAHWRIRDAEAARHLALLTQAEADELADLDARFLAGDTLDRAERERRAALAERATAGPLRALLTVIAEQVAQLEEDIDQLSDDAFIETCAPWAIPYIADLIGLRVSAHPRLAPPRAQVANTIAYRRRKGTVPVLDDAARDITFLPALAVEEFQRLAATQHLNHRRPHATTARLRQGPPAWHLATPLDPRVRGPRLGPLAEGRGRPHIPNISLHLWPLPAAHLSAVPTTALDATRLLLDPLGRDIALVAPEGENLPIPLTLRRLAADPAAFIGPGRAVELTRNAAPIPLAEIAICSLADTGPDPLTSPWADGDPARITLDPERGRLRLPAPLPPGTILRASFSCPGDAPFGAGEHTSASEPAPEPVLRVPAIHPTLAAALAAPALANGGTVELSGSGAPPDAAAPLALHAPAQSRLELRAADGAMPCLRPPAPLVITGGDGAEITLRGLMLIGQPILVPAAPGNRLQRLRLVGCTLLPGLTLDRAGTPTAPSLIVETSNTEIVLEHCITGPLRIAAEADSRLQACILDAGSPSAHAYADPDGTSPGGALRLDACTVQGRIDTREIRLATDSLLLGAAHSVRRQRGVVRFSWVAPGSAVPRRHACLPAEGAALPKPIFHARSFGRPGYFRLRPETDPAIRHGAFDGGEIGAGNTTGLALRLQNLADWLPGYLRFGMEAGIVQHHGGL
jgi:hypothetical protein